MNKYVYRGPSDLLRVGDKVLIRGGQPVGLSVEEVVQFQHLPPGHRLTCVEVDKKPEPDVRQLVLPEGEQTEPVKMVRKKKGA